AKFHDPIYRDSEKLGRVERHLRQPHEELLEREAERRTAFRDDLLAADKERRLHQVEPEPADPAQRQRPRDVRFLQEAVPNLNGMEVLPEMVDLQAVRLRQARNVLDRKSTRLNSSHQITSYAV